MSQITTGVRAILSNPHVYDTLQDIMGAQQFRHDIVTNFIRPQPGSRILDIGCGTAAILTHLPSNIKYWGYDISSQYINAAKKRFGTRGHFQCKHLDRTELETLPKFDVVLVSGVLHHLDDDVAESLFGIARNALGDGGRMITIDPCLAPEQNPIARFLILHDRGRNVRNAEGYRDLASRAFSNVKGTLSHQSWIPYTHWIMECSA
jgi:ubiquinone/menaquinone biosynthesis C-methylase UbiE